MSSSRSKPVGLHAVLAHDDAVFVVTEGGSTEPQGAVFLVDVVVLGEAVQRAVNRTVLRQRTLGIPAVEADAKFAEVLLDVSQDRLEPEIQDLAERAIPDQTASSHDQRIDIRILVAAFRFIGGQVTEEFALRALVLRIDLLQ
jgi:hypothetical protein